MVSEAISYFSDKAGLKCALLNRLQAEATSMTVTNRILATMGVVFLLLMQGCSVVGYSLDQALFGEKQEPHVYVDQNGQHVPPVSEEERFRRKVDDPSSFTSVGAEIDSDIIKALTTRNVKRDMAIRDDGPCLEDEVQVCSISSGCVCRENSRSQAAP